MAAQIGPHSAGDVIVALDRRLAGKFVLAALVAAVSAIAAVGGYIFLVGSSSALLEADASQLVAHGEAIYATARVLPDWWDYFSGGRITTKGNAAYLILQLWTPDGAFALNQLRNDVRRATLLSTGQELQVRRVGRRLLIEGLPVLPPAMPFNVVKLELDGPAEPQFYY